MPTRRLLPILLPAVSAVVLLSGCAGLLGGSKPPKYLFNLTPASKVEAGAAQTGTASDALGVLTPAISQKLATTRIPVQSQPNSVAYLVDAKWVENPARLFQSLLSETIAARTGKLVLDEAQFLSAPGNRLSGELIDFGMDETTRSAIVTYDAVLSNANGEVIRKRRFVATEPVVEITPQYAGDAINRAANKVAAEVAAWVG